MNFLDFSKNNEGQIKAQSTSTIMQPKQEEALVSLSPGNVGTTGITVEILHCKRKRPRL